MILHIICEPISYFAILSTFCLLTLNNSLTYYDSKNIRGILTNVIKKINILENRQTQCLLTDMMTIPTIISI